MKRLLFALALTMPLLAAAQDSPAAAVERARIAAERSRAEADYKAQERICWSKFAVNDCLAAAKARRREILGDLRRQEIGLNDQARRDRAAQRQRDLEQRAVPAPRPTRPEQAGTEQSERDRTAAQRAATRASKEAGHATRPDSQAQARERAVHAQEALGRKQAERARHAQEAAANAKDAEQRLQAAQAHRATVDQREAQRTKPAAKPLPPPAD
jgi:colicin import membrane protein